jgi:hypothetical protein
MYPSTALNGSHLSRLELELDKALVKISKQLAYYNFIKLIIDKYTFI